MSDMENMKPIEGIEQAAADLAELVQLQVEKLKLRLLDNLATLFNAFFGIFVVMVLVAMSLFFLSIGLTQALGAWIGSDLWAMMITAGFFLIASIIVFMFRKHLIINPAVRFLCRVLFEPHNKEE